MAPSSVATLDLSTASDAYDYAFDPDGALRPGAQDDAARAAVRNGAHLVVTQYGQPRLSRTLRLSHDGPDVVPTGIGVWAATATTLAAPWDGEVDGSVLHGSEYELTLTGVDVVSGSVRAGDTLAEVPAEVWVEVGVRPVGHHVRRCSPRASWRPVGLRSPVIRARCSDCLQSGRMIR